MLARCIAMQITQTSDREGLGEAFPISQSRKWISSQPTNTQTQLASSRLNVSKWLPTIFSPWLMQIRFRIIYEQFNFHFVKKKENQEKVENNAKGRNQSDRWTYIFFLWVGRELKGFVMCLNEMSDKRKKALSSCTFRLAEWRSNTAARWRANIQQTVFMKLH